MSPRPKANFHVNNLSEAVGPMIRLPVIRARPGAVPEHLEAQISELSVCYAHQLR
jgi:hypothetical protein